MNRLPTCLLLPLALPLLCSACADTDPNATNTTATITKASQALAVESGANSCHLDPHDPALYLQPDGWTDPARVGSASGERFFGSALAVNEAGEQLVAWLEWDDGPGSSQSVWARRFDPRSQAWRDAMLLEDAPGNAYGVSAALDRAGNAHVVWAQESEQGTRQVWARRFDARSRAWQDPAVLGGEAVQAAAALLAVDRRGNALAVWREEDDAGVHSLWSRRFDARARAWQPPHLIQSADAIATVSADGNAAGNAVVVWKQGEETDEGPVVSCWSRRFDARSQTWLSPEAVAPGDADALSVGLGPRGDAVVAWHQWAEEDGAFGIWARRFDARSQTWLEPAPIENNAGNAREPSVALDRRGNAIVLWRQQGQSFVLVSLWANRFDAASQSWLEAEPVSDPDDRRYIFGFSLDFDRAGNALVAWDGLNLTAPTPASDVLANYFDARSQAWLGPAFLQQNAALPQVAVTDAGDAAMIWHVPPGDGTSVIWASRFVGEDSRP